MPGERRSSDGTPFAPAARALPRPAASSGPALDEAHIRRIWQKLDRFNSGAIQVKDIAANAAFVKQECPRLLEDYERLARGGVVKYQDVRRLLLGLMEAPPAAKRAAPKVPQLSDEELRSLFQALADEEDFITARSLVERRDLAMTKLPALIHDFEKIDLDGDSRISWAELKVFVGGTAEWLELELEAVVGLEELKGQVRSFYRSLAMDQARREQGHDVKGFAKAPHMVFQGNPGTGKTSLGRIMATLLHRIGVTSSSELREVQRPDLVAEHVGQTGPKTQAVVNSAKDGVLFIDEAYRLTGTESKSDFGREAVETLMAAMNEPPGKAPVMICAGYPKNMADFMRANEGLYRRIGYTFDFTDYTCADLAQILDLITRGKGFRLDEVLLAEERRELARLIEEGTLPRARALMNGGLCERLFDAAKLHLDGRDDPACPSVVLLAEDIRAACQTIPPPPEPLAEDPAPSLHHIAATTDATAVPPVPPPRLVPVDAPKQLQMGGAAGGGGAAGRNIWFHVGSGEGLRRGGGFSCALPCGESAAHVVVRLDKRQAHRTADQAPTGARGARSWEETRIVPYAGESLLEFVVFDKGHCIGSAVLALGDLSVFDGVLELRAMDKAAGRLSAKAGWQFLSGETGGDLFRQCCLLVPPDDRRGAATARPAG